jgi:hypothetical protein
MFSSDQPRADFLQDSQHCVGSPGIAVDLMFPASAHLQPEEDLGRSQIEMETE